MVGEVVGGSTGREANEDVCRVGFGSSEGACKGYLCHGAHEVPILIVEKVEKKVRSSGDVDMTIGIDVEKRRQLTEPEASQSSHRPRMMTS
jgi:hypothetical protein